MNANGTNTIPAITNLENQRSSLAPDTTSADLAFLARYIRRNEKIKLDIEPRDECLCVRIFLRL